MNNKTILRLLAPLTLLALAACSTPRGNYVILLAEEGGEAGEISVTNEHGTQITSAVNSVVETSDNKAPKKPRELSEDIVAKLVAETEEAQPPKPLSFFFFFGFDSDVLTEDSRVIFDAVLAEIKTRKTVDISLIGHTDSTGSVEYNRALGLRRAGQLRDLLLQNDVVASAIDIKSLGEEDPLSDGDVLKEKALNRRVVMVLR
ncbi:OmpA family protein [Kiloniella antarctica]|uniref:OmpA family protein n=1 Tax=Kiloniella antarctica TaxID=1550907 RepID=A0ABW5BQS6_9PROT